MAFGLTNTDNVLYTDDAAYANLNNARSVEFVEIGANGFVYVGGSAGLVSFLVDQTDSSLQHIETIADDGTLHLGASGGFGTAVIGATTFLFHASFASSGVSAFSVNAATGVLTNTSNFTDDGSGGTIALHGANSVAAATIGGNTYLFVTSENDDGLAVLAVNPMGVLSHVESVFDAGALKLDYARDVATAVVGGTTYVFTGANFDGISVFSADSSGHLTNVWNHAGGGANNYANGEVETASVDGNTYLISTGFNANGLSVFSVAANGQLANVFNVVDDANIALANPEWIKTKVIGGITYLFVAASIDSNDGGTHTGAVSVWTVNANGSLTNVANVYDDDTTQMRSISSLGVGLDDGTPFADAGISLFELTAPSPPTATNLTNTKTYTEGDASVDLTNIVVTDADVGETITAILTLSNPLAGALTVSGAAGYTAGTGVWTITDTVANVNAALAAVAFTPAVDNDADATITTHIEDAAHTGPANGLITLDVTPANDPPTASNLTNTKTYTEGAASVDLDNIVVSEVDTSPAQTLTATLTLNAATAGVLTTAGGGTYTAGTGVWTITGTATQVNTALASVSFTPATNNDADTTITTRIRDQNAVGPADGVITLDVTPVNDPPTASNLTNTKAYTEGAASVDLDNIVVSEVDTSPAQSITATLTLSNTAAGVLTTAGGGSYNAGTGIWTITDTVANVNIALASVSFTPATDNDVDTTITTHIEDQNAVGPANGSITLDVTPVNDAPTATNLTQIKTYTEDAASVALDDIVVSEVDTSPAQTITATLTLSNNAAGVLTTSGAATYTSGTGVWTITGTVAQVNAALAAMAFTPATDNDVDATITTHIQDQNAAGPADGSITLDVTPVNDAPAAQNGSTGGNENEVINGTLVATDVDSLSLTYSRVAQAAHGTAVVNANGTFAYTPDTGYNGPDSFTFKANDGSADSNVATVTLAVAPGLIQLTGTQGDDSFTALPGNERIDGLQGYNDTVTFNFRLVDATVTYSGNQVIVDGPGSHTILTGFEKYVFTDGTVNNNDGSPLIDDLFYYSRYHDVWNAHVDADAHYNSSGWHEWRDPSAFFSTAFYLAAYQDVKGAGVNPLTQFDQSGWKDGRVPSPSFDVAAYIAANPDVAAAHVDPLAHFLANGAQEGRLPFAPTGLIAANGFDYIYYLEHNPDVLAAHIDPFLHFQTNGWHEGRNPNAFFDTNGYLATYADVKNAGVNPLDHYHAYGWTEGRDPSIPFDTAEYLGHYPDVAAAHIDPLRHFLANGILEGRTAFNDGAWG
jgi:6-phosphogluconolactonase (cycloisomerase 2 family)